MREKERSFLYGHHAFANSNCGKTKTIQGSDNLMGTSSSNAERDDAIKRANITKAAEEGPYFWVGAMKVHISHVEDGPLRAKLFAALRKLEGTLNAN